MAEAHAAAEQRIAELEAALREIGKHMASVRQATEADRRAVLATIEHALKLDRSATQAPQPQVMYGEGLATQEGENG